MNFIYEAPSAEEVEISVFGPGYGESILVHAGFGDWLAIDSCIEPMTKRPVALAYLEALHIDVKSRLKCVVATHWDDDHISGIARMFRDAESAKFVCSAAMKSEQFKALVAAWRPRRLLSGGSGIDEFDDIIQELNRRKKATGYPMPISASVQKLVWERQQPHPAELRALSPSESAVAAAIGRFEEMTASLGTTRNRLPRIEDNHASVVLSLRVQGISALLGADLQVRDDRSLGWLAVVDDFAEYPLHSSYKVPHHGSENGDHDEIWQKLLCPKPVAIITPYVRASLRLPLKSDCLRLLRRTPKAVLTAPPIPKKFRDRDHTVEKTVRQFSRQVFFVPGRFGHVRLRKTIGDASPDWKIDLFGDACRIEEFLKAA